MYLFYYVCISLAAYICSHCIWLVLPVTIVRKLIQKRLYVIKFIQHCRKKTAAKV